MEDPPAQARPVQIPNPVSTSILSSDVTTVDWPTIPAMRMGLSLGRIMEALPTVLLKDDVWAKFLGDNARLGLRGSS
jgi:hypothetical protein